MSDDTPTIRTAQVFDPFHGVLKVSTTNFQATSHFTAPMTTPIASGVPEDASGLTYTAVTSTSAFSRNQAVLVSAVPYSNV